jgi:hypothetical protein
MLGDKHREVLGEILAALSVPVDDLGLGHAMQKLGTFGPLGRGPRDRRLIAVSAIR